MVYNRNEVDFMAKERNAFDNVKRKEDSHYLLLNKDVVIAKFHVDEKINISVTF